MMSPGPKCYIPKFMEIGPLVPEKKMLKGFTIYGGGGHLGHLTNIILKQFRFINVNQSINLKLTYKICLTLSSGF